MGDSLLVDYLALSRHTAFTGDTLARMLGELGSLSHVRQLPATRLREAGFSARQITALLTPVGDGSASGPSRAALDWAVAPDRAIVHFEAPEYPAQLREIAAPPPLLYVEGRLAALREPALAIVGSRRGSAYGLRQARWLAHELAAEGLTICSGMALGIDTAAHEGALAAGGQTIAVMGTGVDVCYPARNRELREKIRRQGALVSEFPLGAPPIRQNFPRRNRIISGLCAGVLVIEASLKSGSLVTAKLALQQNREVFAVPGPISSPTSRGCHQLIRHGSVLVETAEDVLRELPLDSCRQTPASAAAADAETPEATTPFAAAANIVPASAATPGAVPSQNAVAPSASSQNSAPSTAKLLNLLEDTGSLPESLASQTGIPAQQLLVKMLELELSGAVSQRGGRYFREG